ncbi:hypothetical protein QQF64_016969 [Cirrhinus molitorella]|uniref:A-kinase anchor protein 7 RI-RII subunit-binding domain-containing protein n=1 Tax=Cirrhinus molitorella TaxID=172907 RepID=A0ABR3LQZ3_9TELE
MGQLCCFPLSRPEDKLNLLQSRQRAAPTSVKKGPVPDDEELVSLSKRLVEDAVLRAVQQYMEETQQNGTAPKDEGCAFAQSRMDWERERRRTQVDAIKTLLAQENTRAKILQELRGRPH